MENKKGIVLSSGGIDSTTCLAIAIEELGKDNVSSVSITYGQKHNKEVEQAHKIAEYYGIAHYLIDLTKTGIFNNSNCSLLSGSKEEIGIGTYEEQIQENEIVNTYVPFRNGLFISAVASLALSIYPDNEIGIYLGAHADDKAGAAYADCTPEFTKTIGRAVRYGTYGKVYLVSPLIDMIKSEVVAKGIELKAPYELTWSCYEGGEEPCMECATCIDRSLAFWDIGINDPAL